MMNPRPQDFTVVPSGNMVGAEVHGIDLSQPLDDDTFARVEEVFNEHSVVCFRGQVLAEPQYIAFAERFGGTEEIFLATYAHPEYPKIFLVSNIKESGRDIGHADAGRVWHTDMSYTDRPPRATALYALEVPMKDGVALGDTHFASAAAAYDALSGEDKARIEGLIAVHHVSGRRAKNRTSPQNDSLRNDQPTVYHPVVRTHPFTGRKCLYVSEGECLGIEGMEDAEALPLIERLARHVYKREFRHAHKWQVGDVLMWDNCAVQHVATFNYHWPEHRRLMWRITVGGAPTR